MEGVVSVGVRNDDPGSIFLPVGRPHSISGLVLDQDPLDPGPELDLAAAGRDEFRERVADLLGSPHGIIAPLLEIADRGHGIIIGADLRGWKAVISPKRGDDPLELRVFDPEVDEGAPGLPKALEKVGELFGELGHVRPALGLRILVDVGDEPLHVFEDPGDTVLFPREPVRKHFDIPGDIPGRNANVIVGIEDPIDVRMRHEHDVLDLGKSGNEVPDAVPLCDRRGMEGYVEGEAAGPAEDRGISARLIVFFQDQDLEALAGKGRPATQSSKPGADDDGIVLAFGGIGRGPLALGESIPVQGHHRKAHQEGLQEIPPVQ